MLGTLGLGVTLASGPRTAHGRDQADIPQPFSTYGLVPGGGIDQTASLQEAPDKAAQSGTPFFLLPGDYTTTKLELKSGTQIQGVPGKSVLRYNGGRGLIGIEDAADIRLTGLTLAGEAKPIDGGALLVAAQVKGLYLSDCRILGSAEDGVMLRKVSGRIRDCEIGDNRKGGLFSEDAAGLEIAHNHVRDCGARITMCATAAITASWCGALTPARTAPSSRRTALSALPPRAAAMGRTAMA